MSFFEKPKPPMTKKEKELREENEQFAQQARLKQEKGQESNKSLQRRRLEQRGNL